MLELLNAFKDLQQKHIPAVLVTITKKEGSTYRRPGAKLLISAKGECTGLLSGGCLENEIVKASTSVFQSGSSKTITFDMRSDADIIFGLGLGCNGALEMYLERLPLNTTAKSLTDILGNPDSERKEISFLFYQSPDNSILSDKRFSKKQLLNLPPDQLNLEAREKVESFANHCLIRGRSDSIEVESGQNKFSVFVDIKIPVTQVSILGAGPDAVPIHDLAARMGWIVKLWDHRPAFVQKSRFIHAESISLLEPADVLNHVTPSERNFVIIMTHNYMTDLELLKNLLPESFAYVGLLGPATRGEKLLDELTEGGLTIPESMLKKLHSPIGLQQIGGHCPETIALSIIAQIQSLAAEQSPPEHLSKSQLLINPNNSTDRSIGLDYGLI